MDKMASEKGTGATSEMGMAGAMVIEDEVAFFLDVELGCCLDAGRLISVNATPF